MASAGQLLEAGRIPGERIATQVRTSDSGDLADETIADTVTAPLVDDRTYGIWCFSQVQSTVAGDSVNFRLREDSLAGTQMAIKRVECVRSVAGYGYSIYAEYTAIATGNKTFVLTGDRANGTGAVISPASATQVSILYVDYLSG